MSRITQFFIAVLLLVVLAQSSVFAQGGANRTGGYGRLQLDDGLMNFVYLSNQNGSLGIDATGAVSGVFPSVCALLDLSSTTKGFLTPRMTTAQELAICGGAPPEGLIVYNLTTHTLDVYNGSSWGPISGWTLVGNSLPTGGGNGPGENFIGTLNTTDFVIATDVNANGGVGSGGGERVIVSASGTVTINTPATGPAGALTVNGDGLFNGMLMSTGNSNIGTTAGTTNTFGNGGAGTVNLLGGSANFNSIGAGATQNEFGTGAITNYYGFAATTNNIGLAGVSTNNIDGPTNINTTAADATIIGANLANASTTTINVGTVGGNLTLNNIANDNTTVNLLTLTGPGSGNVRYHTLSTLITGSNGVEVTYSGGTADAHLGDASTDVPFVNNRFINTNASLLTITSGAGGGTTLLTAGGSTVGINNVTAGTTNIGIAGGTNNINGTNNNITGTINTVVGTTNVNITGSAVTTIGSTATGGAVNVRTSGANPLTLDVGNLANNLTLNNIANGALATDINFLVMTAPNSGNARWRTLSSFITGSSGVEVTYVGGIADAHFGDANTDVPFVGDRFINTAANTLHITSGAGTDFARFAGAATTINSDAVNAGSTTIGNTTAGGAVNINSSVSTNHTAPANNTTATAGNNTSAASAMNVITGGTGNTMTATTGQNVLNANGAAGNNDINANGAGGTNTIDAAATNTITGGTGNTMTATAGQNVLNANGAGGNNDINANGAGGTNTIDAAAGNTISTTTGANVLNANGAGGNNDINANGAGGTNTVDAAATNTITGGTGNIMAATTGANALNANAAGGQNNLNATGAGGSNNIQGTTNINVAGNFATTIGHLANTGAIALRSNAAGSAITLDVAALANNLTLNRINQDNTQINLLMLTGVNDGNVRTRSLGTLITGSNGVEVSLIGSTLDAHFAPNNASVIFANDRWINTGANTLHIANGTDYATFSSAASGINNTATSAGTSTIGNTTVGGNVTINTAAANTIAVNGTTNINTGAYALTTVGNTTAAQQLRVHGVQNAIVGQTLGANPAVWDLVVVGDQVTTGIAKFGGSIWVDGLSATRNIFADASLLVNTSAGGIEMNPASGLTTVTGNLLVTNNATVNVGITSLTGNIVAQTGDINAVAGNINALQNISSTGPAADIRQTGGGNIVANSGRVGAGTGPGAPTSTLQSGGSFAAATSAGGATALTIANYFYRVTTPNVAVTLPNANTCAGRVYIVKNDGAFLGGDMTTINTGGGNIDGAAADVAVGPNTVRQYISDGTNWYIISTN